MHQCDTYKQFSNHLQTYQRPNLQAPISHTHQTFLNVSAFPKLKYITFDTGTTPDKVSS